MMQGFLAQAIDDRGLRIVTTSALGGITIVDPFGGRHEFAKLPADIELVAKRIQQRYSYGSKRYATLDGFISTHPSLYEITLDDGREIHGLSARQLATLDPGTTIVMSVVKVVTEEDDGGPLSRVSCSWCGAWIELSERDRFTKRRVICTLCHNRIHASFDDAVVVLMGSGGPKWRIVQELHQEPQGHISGMLRNVAVKLARRPSIIINPDIHTLIVDTAIVRGFGSKKIMFFPNAGWLEIGHWDHHVVQFETGYDLTGHGAISEVKHLPEYLSDDGPKGSHGGLDGERGPGEPRFKEEDVSEGLGIMKIRNLSIDVRALPADPGFWGSLLDGEARHLHSLPMLPSAQIDIVRACQLKHDQGWPTEYFPSVKKLVCRNFQVVMDMQLQEAPEISSTEEAVGDGGIAEGLGLEAEWEGIKISPVTAGRKSYAGLADLLLFPWTEWVHIDNMTTVEENRRQGLA